MTYGIFSMLGRYSLLMYNNSCISWPHIGFSVTNPLHRQYYAMFTWLINTTSGREMGDILLELSFSSTDWGNKKGKDDIMGKIKQNVCALLNSKGGKLKLTMTDGEGDGNNIMEVDKIIRPIEQFFQNVIATSGVSKHLGISNQTFNKITWVVDGFESLCTLNYNLFLPTDTQVLLLSPVENDTARDILNINRIVDVTETDRNIPTKFILNCSIGIKESKTVQFKNLKTEKSKCNDLGSRIVHNKLTHYVSAFANHCGGRLYCGIRNDGIVEGEMVQEEDKDVIAKKVIKCINKMKWPEHCGEPQRGRHGQWDISYEPVEDKGNPVKYTYVIVIFVAACPGGVFCSEPESYHIVKGKVEKMEFTEWRKKLLHPDVEPISRSMSRSDWSSRKLRKSCDSLDGKLLRLINNGKWDEFARAVESHRNDQNIDNKDELELVVLSKLYVFYYRNDQWGKAGDILKEFNNLLPKSTDHLIFEVRGRLILSANERTRGNHKESYEIAKDCLPKVEQISACILTAEFYVHFATMLTIIDCNEELKDLLKEDLTTASFKEEAILFYNKALQHLREVSYVPRSKADMEQKTYINLAILNLGCSLSGDIVDHSVSKKAIEAASTSLQRVSESIIQARNPLSGFRKCHWSFAQSSLFYRCSQLETTPERRIELLESALQYAEDAEDLARKRNFHELSRYSQKHASVYRVELEEQEKQNTNLL